MPDKLYAVIVKYTGGKKNPKAVTSIKDSADCYAEINSMKP